MKFSYLLLIIFLIELQFSLAQEDFIKIELLRNELSAGETLQAVVTLNNPQRELSLQNIKLYHNQEEIKISPLFIKHNNNYYIYFDIPESEDVKEGIYALSAEKILFLDQGILKEISKSINFSVSKNTEEILSIKPAFFINPGEEFAIKIKNKGESVYVNILTPDIIKNFYTQDQLVQENTERPFRFLVTGEPSKKEERIVIEYFNKKYEIPIVFDVEEKISPEIPITFLTDAKIINKTIRKNQTLKGPLKFKNMINETLYNITFSLTGNLNEIIKLNFTTLKELWANQGAEQFIWINFDKNPGYQKYGGNIILEIFSYKLAMPVEIYIQEESEEIEEEEIFEEEKEMGGEIEKEGKQEDEEKVTEDIFDFNSTGETYEEKTKEKKLMQKIFIIIIVLIAILIYLVKKSKPIQKITFKDYVSVIERK